MKILIVHACANDAPFIDECLSSIDCQSNIVYIYWESLSQAASLLPQSLILGKILSNLQEGTLKLFNYSLDHAISFGFDVIYLFSMGSIETVRLANSAFALGTLRYRDCYFGEYYYKLRTQKLCFCLRHFGFRHGMSLLFYLSLLQLRLDPFRRRLIFCADGHPWPARHIPSLSIEILPTPRHSAKAPSHSLIFCLQSIDCNNTRLPSLLNLMPSHLGLYYKSHPVPSSDYDKYPPHFVPFNPLCHISEIEIPSSSLLISSSSFVLQWTKNSVTLLFIKDLFKHPNNLRLMVASFAKYQPKSVESLLSLIDSICTPSSLSS